jgi:hypothetical protein
MFILIILAFLQFLFCFLFVCVRRDAIGSRAADMTCVYPPPASDLAIVCA